MLPHLAGANTSTTLGPLQTTTFFGEHSACLAVLVFLLSEAERPRLGQNGPEELRQKPKAVDFDFDFCLSTSIPVLTTSTCVVAWPQGDQFLGGGM